MTTEPQEIRTGKLIGYWFAVPCTVVGIITLIAMNDAPLTLIVTAIFFIGAAIGIKLVLRPKLLLRIHDGHLELYTGGLGDTRCMAAIPLDDIDGFKAHRLSDMEGTTWFLTLHLNTPLSNHSDAWSWIQSNTRSTPLRNDDPHCIHWCLSWPEGGVENVQKKLNQWLKPGIHA